MRRAFAVTRKPAVWLAVVLFLLWTWYFRSAVTPPPQFVVPTGAAAESETMVFRGKSTWPSVQLVSDDGTEVTIGVHEGDGRYVNSRLELWNARTGTNETPALWRDENWQSILADHFGDNTGVLGLLSQPSGRELVRDAGAWESLRKRFVARQTGDEKDRKLSHVLPRETHFSPDGRFMAYLVQERLWVPGWVDMFVEGAWIDDVRTGRNVATLPGARFGVWIAPGGRTAISRQIPEVREGEQPRLYLWDLETKSLRAKLLMSDGHFLHVEHSPDVRFVFAKCLVWGPSSTHHLKWWDATTGRQVGFVGNAPDHALIDNGRVLVTHPWREVKQGGVRDSYRLQFWDTATGASLGEWDLGAPSDGSGLIDNLVASESGRYLAGEYDPEVGIGRTPTQRIADRLTRALGEEKPRERDEIILWDVVDRAELARLPGRSAAFSRDGGWLAAIDGRGVLRV